MSRRLRKVSPALQRERELLELRVEPSARELFPLLRNELLASRPVVGERKVVIGRDKAGRRKFRRETVYGKPTFRNVLEDGELK